MGHFKNNYEPFILATLIFSVSMSTSSTVLVNENIETFTSFPSGSEYLDIKGKYLLSWNIDTQKEIVYFEITAETKGYVGFGFSPNGGMTGADILIAGVKPDGSLYFSDRHGVGNSQPVLDTYSNWNITFGEETETSTKLRFHRLLDTCDDHDFRITEGTMHIIWALGQTDTLNYHSINKGAKSVNFYLKDDSDFNSDNYQVLNLTATMKMPAQHTAYWCTFHKAPLFPQKQHIVAIEPVFENEHALQHTHHFIIYRCLSDDPEKFFQPWIDHPGDFCYNPANSSFPFYYSCMGQMIYAWSKGGKRLIFPQNVGLPMQQKSGQREYFALEIHYDNPEILENVEFKTGGRLFYTPELRQEDAAVLFIEHDFNGPQLLVPPKSTDFTVAGHCSKKCTQRFLPEDGVTIFNNLFHSHLAGRKLKLRHFRGNEELPWIDVDEFYDFNYQQNKPLGTPRKVMRGDQLTVECVYNSKVANNGRAIIGGLSTHDEMCQAIVYYYPRQEFFYCSSSQDVKEHFNLLEMNRYDTKPSDYPGGLEGYDILEPENLAGDYLESVSFKVNWTQEFRERFQREKRFGVHKGSCSGRYRENGGIVKYPEIQDVYTPPDNCVGVTQPSPILAMAGDECGGSCLSGGGRLYSPEISKLLQILMMVTLFEVRF